ncbi:hypothetical protein OUZ56_007370 [Daphnia magna]|uniref:Uncharacterized protein n=1 Tax=Daphnia magna TaxID=35525 RepID=A0ABR0A9R7_9CRUS|nr:hypothetical protein OUZ56_007370 [Daphnia magna]
MRIRLQLESRTNLSHLCVRGESSWPLCHCDSQGRLATSVDVPNRERDSSTNNSSLGMAKVVSSTQQDPTQAPTQSIPSTANPAANGGSKSLPAPAIPTARSTPAIEQVVNSNYDRIQGHMPLLVKLNNGKFKL